MDFKKYKNKVDGIMIGREAYKNPWIFAKNPITSQQKVALVIKYITKLKKLFTGKSINKNSITHIQNKEVFDSNPFVSEENDTNIKEVQTESIQSFWSKELVLKKDED